MSTHESGGPKRWQIDGAGITVLVLLTVVAYFAILAPIARSRLALAGVRSDLTKTGTRASEMRSVKSRANAELARVLAEIDASPVRLEPSDRLNRRLAQLMALATDSGLVIHETRAGDVVTGSRFDLVPIEVSGGGSYPSCGRFLNRLYGGMPDIEVLGFEIAGQPSNPAAVATFRFGLSWYAAPSVASAPPQLGEDG